MNMLERSRSGLQDFLSRLTSQAGQHRAVCHPCPQGMARGETPDPLGALADFARHHYRYFRHFPRYLTALISRVERKEDRQALLANLGEKSGSYSPRDLAHLARSGVAPERELLLTVLSQGSAAEAVGALGLGSEAIVPAIYPAFARALRRLGDVAPRDGVFFVPHTLVDGPHQASLRVLALRDGFWSWPHQRALAMEPAPASRAWPC